MHNFHFLLSLRRAPGRFAAVALAVFATMPIVAAPSGDSNGAAFVQENNAAMDKMMAGMAVKPSGDVDWDFAAMMIPHHQGAIDMALAELRHGRNEQLRRIAQEIIVEQQQEIDAMHLAVGQPLSPAQPAPTQGRPDALPNAGDTGAAAVPAHVHPTH